MAFADETTVTAYLAKLQPEIRDRCRETMAAIRQHGFALGLFSVQNDTIALLQSNPTAPSARHGRPDALSHLDFDPDDYNPARVTPETRVGGEPDVVNLWASSFDADGKPGLGFMLAGFAQETSLQSHATQLLELTRDVTNLAAH
jgi:hypothetical protein